MTASLTDPEGCELTILMPCLDEAETLARCIAKAFAYLDASRTSGEVVVADNGSRDGSQAIARACGARVVEVPRRGYGAALMGGIAEAQGRFTVMGDADDSYDFSDLDGFRDRLRQVPTSCSATGSWAGSRPAPCRSCTATSETPP